MYFGVPYTQRISTTICAIVKPAYQRVMNDIQRTRLSRRRRIWILHPLSRQKVVFLSQSSCVSQVELTYGREGGAKSTTKFVLRYGSAFILFGWIRIQEGQKMAHKKRRNFKISIANVLFYSSGMKTSPLDVLYDSLGLG